MCVQVSCTSCVHVHIHIHVYIELASARYPLPSLHDCTMYLQDVKKCRSRVTEESDKNAMEFSITNVTTPSEIADTVTIPTGKRPHPWLSLNMVRSLYIQHFSFSQYACTLQSYRCVVYRGKRFQFILNLGMVRSVHWISMAVNSMPWIHFGMEIVYNSKSYV